MADLNLTNVTLTDIDLSNLVQRIYQEDFIEPNPFVLLSDFYGSNNDLLNILNKTIANEISTSINKSNDITNLFNNTYGNASIGGIKEDFDNIKDNLFSQSDNINGIKILEYILAQLDPDTYSSLNGLSTDMFDFSNSIGKRLENIETNMNDSILDSLPPSPTLEDVDKVMTVDVDGSIKWKESTGGSGGSMPQVFDYDYRKVMQDGFYILSMDTNLADNPIVWETEIDCGEWK